MQFEFVERAISDYACHNTLEGITKNEIQKGHSHFFKEARHELTYEIWYTLLERLPLAEEDRRAQPQVTTKDSFHSDKSLLWSAAHTKVYALHSTQMIEPFIDTSDPVWLSWNAHCTMLRNMFQPAFTAASVIRLQESVLEHYTLFTTAYPDGELAKNVWNLHMAMDVVFNGTPSQNSCIRMETGHRYFKRLNNSGSLNKKSQIKTMALRYCRHKAFNQHLVTRGAVRTECDLVVGLGGSTTKTVDLLECGELQELLLTLDPFIAHLATGDSILELVYHNKVKYYNHQIVPGRGLCLLDEEGEHVVGRVVALLQAPQLGGYYLIYHRYESGLLPGDYVTTSSLTGTEFIVEFNTCDLTFLTNLLPREREDATKIVF